MAAGKIRYYVVGGMGGGGRFGGQSGPSAIESWVTATFKAETLGGTTVYDLSA